MLNARRTTSILLPIILLPLSCVSSAQIVDVSDCRAIEDRLQRFDCYESLEATEETAAETPPAAQQPAVTRPAIAQPADVEPQASPSGAVAEQNEDVQRFGERSETDTARVIEGSGGKSELIDTVASLQEREPNVWLITLESGQQWLQMEGKLYPMRVGEEVRIYPSRWGNAYRLTAPRISSFIQVERVD